jgi:acetolactate synthase-1/2/3 large subunit
MANEADRIIEVLRRSGVQRLFGVPGGGSTADLIEAARAGGLSFTLAHTETGSAFMASAQAEITRTPAACVATLGPGAASLVNGVANAFLDRVPLIREPTAPPPVRSSGVAPPGTSPRRQPW